MTIIAVPKYGKLGSGFSKREMLKASEAAGRPSGQTAGTWVSDLVSCQKLIALCPFCVSKFNPRANNYATWRKDIYSIGKCDGCNQVSTYLKAYIHESTVPEVGEWERKPTKGRWSLSLRRAK